MKFGLKPAVELASGALSARFYANGREPQCPPNLLYPNGRPIDAGFGLAACRIDLTHPTPGCGVWVVDCSRCGVKVAITAAGRPDDPSRVGLSCKLSS